MFRINQTGYSPAIRSLTNYGEGFGNWSEEMTNASFMMGFMKNNLIVYKEFIDLEKEKSQKKREPFFGTHIKEVIDELSK